MHISRLSAADYKKRFTCVRVYVLNTVDIFLQKLKTGSFVILAAEKKTSSQLLY